MKFARFILLFLFGCAVFAVTVRSGDVPNAKANPIPIADVRSRGIAGELGEPLGKVVRIHAILVDGDTLRFKAAASNTYLRVMQVDDRKLPEPVTVQLANAANGHRIKTPAFGQTVICRGYETGGYGGIVYDPTPHPPGVVPAGIAYGFGNEFIAWDISVE